MKDEETYTNLVEIASGDCYDVMAEMPDASVHAVVTDPPYGLGTVKDLPGLLAAWATDSDERDFIGKSGFMGRDWDAGVPAPRYWREVYRVLKPGGYALVFAGSRTQDLMGISLRLAGFEVRDSIMWVHGQGFPKNRDVGKAIDNEAGVEREVIGTQTKARAEGSKSALPTVGAKTKYETRDVTAPGSEAARTWDGWGTALKPSYEPVLVCRRPHSEKTIAQNVLKHSTGAMNIRASSVGSYEMENPPANNNAGGSSLNMSKNGMPKDAAPRKRVGRWPANLILSDEAAAALDEQSGYSKSSGKGRKPRQAGGSTNFQMQPGVTHEDEGGASRYFLNVPLDDPGEEPPPAFYYVAKAAKDERNAGLESHEKKAGGFRSNKSGQHITRRDGSDPAPVANNHPTVKPVKIMRYLVRMITPPGGIVFDPFAGSGSTGIACVREGFGFVGVEREPEFVEIAKARIEYAVAQVEYEARTRQWNLFDDVELEPEPEPAEQIEMF